METFNSFNQIIDFAVENEQRAVDFYSKLAENARNQEMKTIFEGFAKEEMGHKAKLLEIKEIGIANNIKQEEIKDLKIADYTIKTTDNTELNYEDALVLAMKREKAAFKLYLKLSEKIQDSNLKDVFMLLAQEESKHKLRFEIEYDEYVLREN